MARRSRVGWWSIRVELVGGGMAGQLWPRPGRIFAVSPRHTFHAVAEAIDDAFARWDRSHLHEFALPRAGKTVTEHRYVDDIDPVQELDADTLTLGEVLRPGDTFTYTFDLGDNWRHDCVIANDEIDPVEQYGVVPDGPVPYWGWGVIPDAYGRFFDGDDGERPIPDPPQQPWPWAHAPDPTVITVHCPGQYTRTSTVHAGEDEDKDKEL